MVAVTNEAQAKLQPSVRSALDPGTDAEIRHLVSSHAYALCKRLKVPEGLSLLPLSWHLIHSAMTLVGVILSFLVQGQRRSRGHVISPTAREEGVSDILDHSTSNQTLHAEMGVV